MSDNSFIHKHERKDRNFTIIQNEILRSDKLSWKAKGLYCTLMSLPENWRIVKGQLKSFSNEGKDGTATAFNELEKNGFIAKEVTKDEGGMPRVLYHFFEFAEDNKMHKPECCSPESGFPEFGISESGKSVSTNKDLNKYRFNTNTFSEPTVQTELCSVHTLNLTDRDMLDDSVFKPNTELLVNEKVYNFVISVANDEDMLGHVKNNGNNTYLLDSYFVSNFKEIASRIAYERLMKSGITSETVTDKEVRDDIALNTSSDTEVQSCTKKNIQDDISSQDQSCLIADSDNEFNPDSVVSPTESLSDSETKTMSDLVNPTQNLNNVNNGVCFAKSEAPQNATRRTRKTVEASEKEILSNLSPEAKKARSELFSDLGMTTGSNYKADGKSPKKVKATKKASKPKVETPTSLVKAHYCENVKTLNDKGVTNILRPTVNSPVINARLKAILADVTVDQLCKALDLAMTDDFCAYTLGYELSKMLSDKVINRLLNSLPKEQPKVEFTAIQKKERPKCPKCEEDLNSFGECSFCDEEIDYSKKIGFGLDKYLSRG